MNHATTPQFDGSLTLAIGSVFVSAFPVWALVLSMAKSAALSRFVSERPWVRLATAGYLLGTLLVGSWWWLRILGPDHVSELKIVCVVWLAHLLVIAFAMSRVRARTGRAPPPGPAPRSLAPVAGLLAAWIGGTALFVFLRFGSGVATQPSARDWIALAAACAVIAVLVWLLITNVRARSLDRSGKDAPTRRQG